MKTKNLILAVFAVASCFGPQLSSLQAQGALAPPGAPAPTMRTLDQIYSKLDPRVPISTTNTPGDATDTFIISQPGSYYLTTNITAVAGKNLIEITANNVTLDLGGFSLLGVPGGTNGIALPNACTNITVRNGNIHGFGFVGVASYSPLSGNLAFERLNVSSNFLGLVTEGAGAVRDCNFVNNQNTGVSIVGGIISGCTAVSNGGNGISVSSASVIGCAAQLNGNDGFAVTSGTLSGCSANNDSAGIFLTAGNAYGCQVTSNAYIGIYLFGSDSVVTGNNCFANNTVNDSSSAGIEVLGSNNRVEDNHVSGSGHAGIYVLPGLTGNIIIKNSVSGNGANNYSVPSGNVFGPIVNQSNGTLTNTSPVGNFSF